MSVNNLYLMIYAFSMLRLVGTRVVVQENVSENSSCLSALFGRLCRLKELRILGFCIS